MANLSSISPQAQEVLLKIYVGQNINRAGILQSQVKDKEQTKTLLSKGLIKENHWYLHQFLTTNKGSEIAKALVKTRIEKNENSLQTKLQEIPKKVLGFFMKRHVSKRLVFPKRKLVPTRKLQFIFVYSWEDYVLANGRIWILWDKFFTSLSSVGLCVKTSNYVSTRGGELRDLCYVISPEIQEFLVNRYGVSDFTPSQESALETYPFLMSSVRAIDVDDKDFARQRYYELLKDYSITEGRLAGIVNDMNSKRITSEYRGLLSEDKPFDILDISRFKIYLDKNLIEPAVDILLEREAKIKEYIIEKKIPALSEVKSELGFLDYIEQGDFYILVSSLERQLREFIKKKLGKGWIKRIENDIPSVIEEWKEKKRKDKRWGIEPEQDLISYADLGDYILIVKKYRRMFADSDDDLGDIITYLKMWYNYGRNPIMHSRTLNKQKYFTTKSAIDFLKQWISRRSY